MSITYKNLYTQVKNLVDSRIVYNTKSAYRSQQSHTNVAPFALKSSAGDISINTLLEAVVSVLQECIPQNIISGLEVTAENPISANVVVSAGKGTANANIYELLEDTTLTIPFDAATSVFYINLHQEHLVIEKGKKDLTVAKIVVPKPGITSLVQDTNDGGWNAYIQNFKEYRLYGINDKFEEDTIALFRDNIGDILADNLIGNIRLNENLKITNVAGTLALDSNKLLLMDYEGHILSKLNSQGVYFYDTLGAELAKFTTTGARVGNIVITTTTIQSANFVSGALGAGFQIKDIGDAEFNNVRLRGKFTSSVFEKETISSIGGNLLVSDSDILAFDMTSSDTSTIMISGDTTFTVGDILRIKDGVDDEWFQVTDTSSAPVYTVTRDMAGDYASNSNPSWKKGIAIINYGSATDGMIYMTASESNAPYISVINTGATPWISPTTRLRIGNLNGFLDYVTDAYGIAIGDTNNYLKYDVINGLRIKGNITISGGTHIPVTFYQAVEPGSSGDTNIPVEGDYWVDTNDNNKLYIYQSNSWVAITGGGGGITSFTESASSGIPTSLSAGDLWYNTDNNRLYRAAIIGATTIGTGQWELTLSSLGATPTLSSGLYLSSDYLGFYDSSDWKCYIKNDGTFYFGGNASNSITWNGVTLSVRGLLNAEDIVSGYIDVDRLQASSITADKLYVTSLSALSADLGTITAGTITGVTITGTTIQTATSGARIRLTPTGMIATDGASGAGNEIFKIISTGDDAGDVVLGEYDRNKGAKWDESADTFSVKGSITATSGSITGSMSVGTNLDIDGDNESVRVFGDFVTIESGVNDDLDWTENASTKTVALTAGDYTPSDLAAHVQVKMRDTGDANTTVTYSSTTRKITITNSTLSTLTFLWSSGANTITTCGRALGFDVTADDTGALSYLANYQTALRVEMGLLQ